MTKKTNKNKKQLTPQEKWQPGDLLWGSHPGKPNGQYQDTQNKKGHLHMLLEWDGEYCYLLPLSTGEKDKWLEPDGKNGLWGKCGPTWDSMLKCKPGKWWGNNTMSPLSKDDTEKMLQLWEQKKQSGKYECQDKYLLPPMCQPSMYSNYKQW